MITKEFIDLCKASRALPIVQRAEVMMRMLDESYLQIKELDASKTDNEIWQDVLSSVDLIKPAFGVYRSREVISFALHRTTKMILRDFVKFLESKNIITNAKELILFINSLKYEEVINISGLENSYFRTPTSVITYIDDVGKCLYYEAHKNDKKPAPDYNESTMLLDEKVVSILLWNGIIPANMIKLNKNDVYKINDQCFISMKKKQIPISEEEYQVIKCYTKLEKRSSPPTFPPARPYKKTNKLIRGSRGTPTANGLCALLKRFNSFIEEKTPYTKKLTVYGLASSKLYSEVYEKEQVSQLSVFSIIKQMTGADNSVASCQSKEYLIWKKIFYPEQ